MFHRMIRCVIYRVSRYCRCFGLFVFPIVFWIFTANPLQAQIDSLGTPDAESMQFLQNYFSDDDSMNWNGPLFYANNPLSDNGPEPFILLPKGFIYSTYLADPLEPRAGTQWGYEQDDGWLWDSTLGGRVGLIRWGPEDFPAGVQLDILGAAKLRMDPQEDMDVRSVDYRVDVPLTWGEGPHRFKLGYSHISSHLGDEFLLKNPGFDRLNYLRDSLVFGYSFYPQPSLRLYGEAEYGFNTSVATPWHFKFGADYAPAFPTGTQGAPFAAFNVNLREEVDYSGGFAAQAGWAWRGSNSGSGLLRTGLFYYNGKSPQFSFYDTSEQQLGLGMWYDY